MAKLSVRSGAAAPSPAPQAGVAAAPVDPNSFVDGRGRKIRVRDLSVLEQMRLLRLVGGENAAYYNFCLRLARVAAVGEFEFPVPEKNVMFEAIAKTLGEDGIYSLTLHFMPKEDETEVSEDPAAAKAEAAEAEQKERDLVKN